MHIYSGNISSWYPPSLITVARGTLQSQSDTVGGLVSGLATQAQTLKIGTGDDDRPTVVVEFDTGFVYAVILVTIVIVSSP